MMQKIYQFSIQEAIAAQLFGLITRVELTCLLALQADRI
jgi:hypothetical protein